MSDTTALMSVMGVKREGKFTAMSVLWPSVAFTVLHT